MDHSTHTRLNAIDFTPETLANAVVYGANDHKIGTVSHVHGIGEATQVIVDVGGFLGMGTKPVMLTSHQLTFMRAPDGTVHATTTWTKDQIKALPEYNDTVHTAQL